MIPYETVNLIGNIFGPLIVGLVIWLLGEKTIDKRNQNEAIRDLMTFRGDFSNTEFRRALNKISITFHKDSDIRKEIRDLYDIVNNPTSQETNVNRKIVGLIYNLCQKNGFNGITEYDIDQAFPESKQSPMITPEIELSRKQAKENNKISQKIKKNI